MNEDQKKFFYYLESMRDGCTRDILCGYMDEKLVDEFLKEFLEKDYIYQADPLIFINYSKVSVNTWIDVEIM
jgi:hypothetical protein